MKLFSGSRDMAVTQASVTALLFLIIPLFHLMGYQSPKLPYILHGLASSLTLILSCSTLHAAYVFHRIHRSTSPLNWFIWSTNIAVLLGIITGNWLYMVYRAPDSRMQWFLYHAPPAHTVVMEFKEFVVLFPLPLGIAAGLLLYRFRFCMKEADQLPSLIMLLITMMWFCLVIGFVTGIGLAMNG